MPRYGSDPGGKEEVDTDPTELLRYLVTVIAVGKTTITDLMSLFDRESVMGMVSSGVTPTYDSDCENSEPTGTERTLLSHVQSIGTGINATSTPLREHNPPSRQSFCNNGLQPPHIVSMLQESSSYYKC